MVRLSVYRKERYYVYALAYPQDYYDDGSDLGGIVFYIGKGTDDRIDSHEMEAGNRSSICHCKKCKVIRKIWTDGKHRKYHSGIRNVVFSRVDVERLKRQLEEVRPIDDEE